jgi:ribosomal protein S25
MKRLTQEQLSQLYRGCKKWEDETKEEFISWFRTDGKRIFEEYSDELSTYHTINRLRAIYEVETRSSVPLSVVEELLDSLGFKSYFIEDKSSPYETYKIYEYPDNR